MTTDWKKKYFDLLHILKAHGWRIDDFKMGNITAEQFSIECETFKGEVDNAVNNALEHGFI